MKTILLNITAIVGFLILFEPYYKAKVNKQKFEFKEHAFKITLGFVTLIMSIIINITFKADAPLLLKEEFKPFIELAQQGSYIHAEKKDTIDYGFRFINNGKGNATSLKMTITAIAIVNSTKSVLVGTSQNINLVGLIAGDTKTIENYNFSSSKIDSVYFYITGEYDKNPIEYLIRWYPGLTLIKTMGQDRIDYISDIIKKYNKK